MNIDDPYNEGAFMLTSHSESDFEVLYGHNINVAMKMGLYIEIFYSPYDDEVLELYLGERYDSRHEQADSEDDYDNNDKGNLERFVMNKYKSAKSIWVDLEPGAYTLQIVLARHADPNKHQRSFYEDVHFQLYIRYDFVNVPREVFLPSFLNYHGLLGVGDETHDFGHTTLFWDDLTLWHHKIDTLFQVQSEMVSVSIQLEQLGEQVMIRLLKQEGDDWIVPDLATAYPTVTSMGQIDTIEAFGLQPRTIYKLEIFKDSYAEHDHVEDVEMGERYDISFSLKIDFSEFDDKSIANNLQKNSHDVLPHTMDQVTKNKRSMLGLQEKSFTMGNRNMIHLIEYGDGY